MAVKKLMKRSEVPAEYKWAIEDLYSTDAAWNTEYDEVLELLKKVAEYEGRLTKSTDALLAYLNLYSQISHKLERIIVYSNEKYHEDTSNSVYQDLASRAENLAVAVEGKTSFVLPELLSADTDVIEGFLRESEELRLYQTFLQNLLRRKAHILSKEMEELMAASGEVTSAPSNIFSMMNNADLKFPVIKDENGEEVQITQGRYTTLMMSPDRSVRKAAFEGMYSVYGQFKNTIASIYSANCKATNFEAKARKYNSTLEMQLDENNIPVNVYTNLLDVVHDRLPVMHKYVALRKKLLGVDELHMYDVYTPIVSDVTMEIPFEEAKKTVYEALAPLGQDYLGKLKEGFDNQWIDIYENEGKRTGAYSWGAYGTHPYVLLNYQDNLDNMFTLAHEMGHALHTYHSNETQPYIYAGYKIFVAEVASTCNEALLMQYLLEKTTDKMQKAYLLNHFLEQFKSTLYRQAMFAEFEMITHAKAEAGETLTADSLCKIYHDLNVQYFGKDMVVDAQIDLEWAKIPHFYTPFYVYQYATGYSAAIALSRRILKEGEPAVQDYIRFLSGGSSTDPISLLKIAGVDMSSKKPVEEALALFDELLDEMNSLMEE